MTLKLAARIILHATAPAHSLFYHVLYFKSSVTATCIGQLKSVSFTVLGKDRTFHLNVFCIKIFFFLWCFPKENKLPSWWNDKQGRVAGHVAKLWLPILPCAASRYNCCWGFCKKRWSVIYTQNCTKDTQEWREKRRELACTSQITEGSWQGIPRIQIP